MNFVNFIHLNETARIESECFPLFSLWKQWLLYQFNISEIYSWWLRLNPIMFLCSSSASCICVNLFSVNYRRRSPGLYFKQHFFLFHAQIKRKSVGKTLFLHFEETRRCVARISCFDFLIDSLNNQIWSFYCFWVLFSVIQWYNTESLCKCNSRVLNNLIACVSKLKWAKFNISFFFCKKNQSCYFLPFWGGILKNAKWLLLKFSDL